MLFYNIITFLLAYPGRYIIIKYSGRVISLKEASMINFEKELKNFKPSAEVEDAEEIIKNHDLTDVTDLITEMLREAKGNR